MMKKAQIEIVGLGIVAILIMIGMIFLIRFMMEEPIQYKKQFTQTQLTSNMLNALLKITSSCNSFSMTELLQHCSQNLDINCSGNIMNSCDYAEQEAKKIFSETLEKWDVDYEFKVFYVENDLFTLGKACVLDKKSKLFPIPTNSGILSVKLDICG